MFLLSQKTNLYNIGVNFANSCESIASAFAVGEESTPTVFSKKIENLVKITQLSQTRSGRGVFGRAMGPSDKPFAKIKGLKLGPNDLESGVLDSVIAWTQAAAGAPKRLRKGLTETIMGYLPHSHQTLITDMVFGQVFKLDSDSYHKLKVTGLLHVVAASGFNVSLITILSNYFTRHFGRFKSFLIWWVLVGGYVLMTDLSISILRAFLMMFLKKIGAQFGLRNNHNLYSLATASFVILLLNPLMLENISFQLSVAATFSIIIFMPLFGVENPAIENDSLSSIKEILKESFQTTFSAQLLTTPIILYHFAEFSLLSIFSNVALLWLTPLITLGGVLIYILTFLSTFLPIKILINFLSLYLWLITEIFLKSVGLLSKFDFLYFQEVLFTQFHLILYLVVVAIIYYKLRIRNEKNKKAVTIVYSVESDIS